MRVRATIQGIASGPASLTIPTTIGNELVHCTVASTTADCSDFLVGTPLIGSTITLSLNQAPAARGLVRECGDGDKGKGGCHDHGHGEGDDGN